MVTNVLLLFIAYLIGSIPTALLVSRLLAGVDIRRIGDGNMGARNVTRTLGPWPGMIVGGADFCKGAGAVLLVSTFGRQPSMQLAAGVAAVLGHDFTIMAGFRGGQGLAATLGVLFVLMPTPTLFGLLTFAVAFLVLHNFNLSAGLGLSLIVFLAWRTGVPNSLILYTSILFVSHGLKKWLDLPRMKAVTSEEVLKDQQLAAENGEMNNEVSSSV